MKRPTKHQHANGFMAILEDSMLRDLILRNFAAQLERKLSLRATTSDMNHYVQPAVEKNPDVVIL